MPPTVPVILHLTDLHFGWDARNPNAQNLRNTSQQTLLNTIDGLPASWKPTVICLSGDIGWHGAQTDYEAAAAWLNELLSRCGLSYDRVIVAAGNHDIMREEASYVAPPGTAEAADLALRVPIGPPYKAAFAHFTQFCERANIPAMQLHGADSWLAGERMLDGVRFVSVNSSWFCRGDHDLGKLWVGLPQLRDLEARHQLGRIVDPATPLTVTLVHHPPDWWHEAETHTYGSRPNTRNFLADRSHLLLTGHTHARAARPDRLVNAAYHFPGAAAYAGGGHPNGFRLIRLAEQFDYRSYEYDSGEDRPTWRWVEGEEASVARQTAVQPAAELGAAQKKKPRP